MAKITRFFENVRVRASGTEITNLIGGISNYNTGTIEQIVITRVSGAATLADIQIRYESGTASRHKLVYLKMETCLTLLIVKSMPHIA